LEWARKTTDLTNGLQYHLYCFHRVLIGDNIFEKSFFPSYFALLTPQQKELGPSVGRIFANFVAFQAQGFGVLEKARQILEIPPLDYNQTIQVRAEQQLSVAMNSLDEVLHISPWNNSKYVGRSRNKGILFGTAGSNGKQSNHGTAFYYMVPDSRSAISEVTLDDTIEFRYGSIKPGETQLENIRKALVYWLNPDGTRQYLKDDMIWNPSSIGGSPLRALYNSRPKVIDPKYSIVGFKMSQ
jgi:hypothetical protein